MDAHDAKSYPGEPTTSLLDNPISSWSDNGAVTTTSNVMFGGELFVRKCVNTATGSSSPGLWPIDGGTTVLASTQYTLSIRGFQNVTTGGGNAYLYVQNQSLGSDLLWTGAAFPNEEEYFSDPSQQIASSTFTTPAGTTLIRVGVLFAGMSTTGGIFYIKDLQLEQKGYATPFVREGKGGTGTYNARPASVNLMIHGNVGTGQSFSDSSPSKHTITVNGNTTHSTAQSKFSGGSIYFDGSDGLQIADSDDWNFGSGDYTLDCWIYPTAINIYGGIINQGEHSGNYQLNSLEMYTDGYWPFTGNIRWLIRNTSPTQLLDIKTPSGSIALNSWYHIAAVKNGTSYKIYIDGVESASGTQATALEDLSWPMYIGQRSVSGGANYYYQGYIDEARITKGTALWTSNFTPPTRRNDNGPLVDLSGNDNGGNFATKETTDVATYRDGEVIRPIDNAVWDFDGTDDAILVGSSGWNYINNYDVSGPFTISLWVYPESGGSTLQGLLINGEWSSLVWVTYFIGLQSNRLKFQGYGASSAGFSIYPTQTLGTGAWHHVVGTFNGTTATDGARLYVDGVLYDSATSTAASVTYTGKRGGIYLGSDYSNNTAYLTGKMGAVQFYKGALTAQQVKENFNQQNSRFNVPNWRNRDIVKNGLKVWLDAGISESYSGSGTTWYDISGNNYDAALSGPAWDSSGYFVFDGSTDKAEIGSFPYTNFSTSGGGTIEIWYKMRGTANNGMLIDCCDPAGGGSPYTERDYFSIRTNWGGGDTAAYFKNNSDSFSDLSFTSAASGAAAVSNWVYIAYTVDINAVTTKAIYEYGVQVNSTTASIGSWNTNLSQILIGRDVLPGGNEVNANIAVVRVYGRALSASEIEQNFIVQRQRFGV
jgi:hypothetical protein